MGRKPYAARRNQEKGVMSKLEGTNAVFERVSLQPGNRKPPPERMGAQPKYVNPSSSGVGLHPESSIPSLVRARQSNQPGESVERSKPRKKDYTGAVRRSVRIQSALLPSQNLDIEPVILDVTLSDSEKEDDPPAQRKQNESEPTTYAKKNLEEKVNDNIQRLETLEKIVEALMSKTSRVDVTYKNLYIDSQKKVESLTEEKKQLAMKLDVALVKLESYERGDRVVSEALEKLKDVILISNLTKATETAVNASSQAFHNALSAGDVLGSRSHAGKKKKAAISK